MGRVRKKSGSGGYGNFRNLKSRVRVCRVLKKLGFGREFSGSGIPGPITSKHDPRKIEEQNKSLFDYFRHKCICIHKLYNSYEKVLKCIAKKGFFIFS